MNAFEQGYQMYLLLREEAVNPFPANTFEAEDWNDGLAAAVADELRKD